MSLDAHSAGCLTGEFVRMCYFIPICNIQLFYTIYQVFGKGARTVGNQFLVPEGICSGDGIGMQCLLTLDFNC